jgi:hypothetical protein
MESMQIVRSSARSWMPSSPPRLGSVRTPSKPARGMFRSVTPRRTFARVQPTTKNRVDLALRLEAQKPSGRLQHRSVTKICHSRLASLQAKTWIPKSGIASASVQTELLRATSERALKSKVWLERVDPSVRSTHGGMPWRPSQCSGQPERTNHGTSFLTHVSMHAVTSTRHEERCLEEKFTPYVAQLVDDVTAGRFRESVSLPLAGDGWQESEH